MLVVEKQSWFRKNIYAVTLSIGIIGGGFAGWMTASSNFAITIGIIVGACTGLLVAMLMSV